MPRLKTCKGCFEQYEKMESHPPFRNWCSVGCAVRLSRALQDKARDKAACKAKAADANKLKASNRAHRQRKADIKPLSWHLAQAQVEFNKFIRLRDAGKPCVSCDKPATWQGQWHASHYRPRGMNSSLRFNELNCFKSCSECNNHKSGNLTPYRVELIKRIGITLVEWLEAQNAPTKWTIYEAKQIREHYRLQCKALTEA
jgi:hypothetical protein